MPKDGQVFKDDKIRIYSVNPNATELLFLTHGGWNEDDGHTTSPPGTSLIFYTPHSEYGKNSTPNQLLQGNVQKTTSIAGGGAKLWNYELSKDDRANVKAILKDYADGKPYMRAAQTYDILTVGSDKACLLSYLFGLITAKKIKAYQKIHFTACRVVVDDNGGFKNFTWENVKDSLKKIK